jgi:hypothetical protein
LCRRWAALYEQVVIEEKTAVRRALHEQPWIPWVGGIVLAIVIGFGAVRDNPGGRMARELIAGNLGAYLKMAGVALVFGVHFRYRQRRHQARSETRDSRH